MGAGDVTAVRLPPEIRASLDALAESQSISRSEMIRVAVTDYLKRKRALPKE